MCRAAFASLVAFITILLQIESPRAQEVSYQNLIAPVLAGGETVIGETIVYPSGAPARVTAAIVTVPPGGQTGWHVHPVPLFAYILEGELVVNYNDRGQRTYRVGEGLLEAMKTRHNGRNNGSVPVRILAVYIGAEGRANAEAAEAPKDLDAARSLR